MEQPVRYQSMQLVYERPGVVISAGGETPNFILPHRARRLQIVTLFSSWSPQTRGLAHAPHEVVVVDAETNELVERVRIGKEVLQGVPTQAVPRSPATMLEIKPVLLDMDVVLPDFAAGRPPQAPEAVAARDRLRSAYTVGIPKEHVVIYQRLSPAWFAFLDGDPAFAALASPTLGESR